MLQDEQSENRRLRAELRAEKQKNKRVRRKLTDRQQLKEFGMSLNVLAVSLFALLNFCIQKKRISVLAVHLHI